MGVQNLPQPGQQQQQAACAATAHKSLPGAAAAAADAAQQDQHHADIVARAARKLNRTILPFCLVFSIIASLDRAAVSYAALSMSAELNFDAETYGIGAAIFFLSYSLFQVPSNIAVLYSSGPFMLGTIAVAWGLTAASMAAITSRAGFLAVRFMLGIAEAGTVPGCWAYLSTMYPSEHMTLPTTFYMAGITAAQALGAPLAAGLLSLDGMGHLSGWRYLFIIEGVPAVLLGFWIWACLPRRVLGCRLLTPAEQQHLQAAIDGTIPPSSSYDDSSSSGGGGSTLIKGHSCPAPSASSALAPLPLPATTTTTVVRAVTTPSPCSSRRSSAAGGGSSCCVSPRVPPVAAAGASLSVTSERAFAELRQGRAGELGGGGPPSRQQLVADLKAAACHRVVWCASGWRFLYLLALNGLIYWAPLIVAAMAEPATHGAAASGGAKHSETRVLLLAAVPYVGGVAVHILNALHSNRVNERRLHIAVPWALGAVFMLALPAGWRAAGTTGYLMLVLASLGVMGCDGIDVSWIISLFNGLSASQTVLALAYINTLANIGGFVGNYLIGFIKQSTGSFDGAMFLMGSVMMLAAAAVASFPAAWAHGGSSPSCEAAAADVHSSTIAAAQSSKSGDQPAEQN